LLERRESRVLAGQFAGHDIPKFPSTAVHGCCGAVDTLELFFHGRLYGPAAAH
jgi:hypothetical protein